MRLLRLKGECFWFEYGEKRETFVLKLQEPGSGGGLGPDTLNVKVSLPDLLGGFPEDVRYHTITKDTPYRLWNLVSNGLIQPNNDDPPVVTCRGQFGDNNSKE